MLERLPLEIQIKCLSYLDTCYKLECLTVCKAWQSIIQTTGELYKSHRIEYSEDFDAMYCFFEKHPELGGLVKSLSIKGIGLNIFSYLILPDILPDLQRFHLIDPYKPIRDWDEKQALKQFSKWTELRSLEEIGAPIAAPALLKASPSVCANLVCLTMGFMGYEREPEKLVFIKHLQNAPNLEILSLHWVNLSTANIETIQEKLPKLKALALISTGLLPIKKGISISKPALQMESLLLEGCTIAGNAGRWLDFISAEYPNLKNLIIANMEDGDNDGYPYFTDYEEDLIKMMTRLKHLEYYRNYAYQITDRVFDAMDNAGIRLKKIELGSFDTLEDVKMLLKSDQINSIESLTLAEMSYSSYCYYFEGEDGFLKELAKIPNLRHLRIDQSKEEVEGPDENRVPLDLLLEILNSIESITMDFATFDIKRKDGKPFETHLKKLVMEECYVNAEACSKEDRNFVADSEEYLRQVLPKTEIITRQLDEDTSDEEYSYLFRLDDDMNVLDYGCTL